MSNGHPWDNRHTMLLIELNDAGCSDHVIAGATGHDVETVGRHRRALGIQPQYRSVYATWLAIPAASLKQIRAGCRLAA